MIIIRRFAWAFVAGFVTFFIAALLVACMLIGVIVSAVSAMTR